MEVLFCLRNMLPILSKMTTYQGLNCVSNNMDSMVVLAQPILLTFLGCHVLHRLQHKEHKMNLPSRTYNITVSHVRQLLGNTSGHPATCNDKIVVLYDNFVRGVHDKDLSSNNAFII